MRSGEQIRHYRIHAVPLGGCLQGFARHTPSQADRRSLRTRAGDLDLNEATGGVLSENLIRTVLDRLDRGVVVLIHQPVQTFQLGFHHGQLAVALGACLVGLAATAHEQASQGVHGAGRSVLQFVEIFDDVVMPTFRLGLVFIRFGRVIQPFPVRPAAEQFHQALAARLTPRFGGDHLVIPTAALQQHVPRRQLAIAGDHQHLVQRQRRSQRAEIFQIERVIGRVPIFQSKPGWHPATIQPTLDRHSPTATGSTAYGRPGHLSACRS